MPAAVVTFIGTFTKTLLKSVVLASCSAKNETLSFASELSDDTANFNLVADEFAKVTS